MTIFVIYTTDFLYISPKLVRKVSPFCSNIADEQASSSSHFHSSWTHQLEFVFACSGQIVFNINNSLLCDTN